MNNTLEVKAEQTRSFEMIRQYCSENEAYFGTASVYTDWKSAALSADSKEKYLTSEIFNVLVLDQSKISFGSEVIYNRSKKNANGGKEKLVRIVSPLSGKQVKVTYRYILTV